MARIRLGSLGLMMSNEIQIVPLSRSSRDVMRFLKVSYGIYRDDPQWVAPLLMDLKKKADAGPSSMMKTVEREDARKAQQAEYQQQA